MILKLCDVKDLPAEGMMRPFRRDGVEICLARLAGGRLAVFGNRCPHQGAPLSAGSLQGSTVVCPYHTWRFDVVTGASEARSHPGLHTFEARQYGDEVFVCLPSPDSHER